MYLVEMGGTWYKQQRGCEYHTRMNTYRLETACSRIPSQLPLQTREDTLQWGMGGDLL